MTVISSFFIMLCLGGIYAWSIFVPELYKDYGFSSFQTQLIFGVLIAVFPVTMIFAGKILNTVGPRTISSLSGIFFGSGYLIAGLSRGNFTVMLIGAGLFAGIGTGLGYLVAISIPIQWYPKRKGLITGFSAAGFGLAAIILSNLAEWLIIRNYSILQIFVIIGITYSITILFFSLFIKSPNNNKKPKPIKNFIFTPRFAQLISGIFLGTFAGLMIIGNLKPIGELHNIPNHYLIIGVSFFALANFSGRIIWGFLSDFMGAEKSILTALTLQALAIFAMGFFPLSPYLYIVLSFIIGFNFGSNFVLFAKETSHVYGVENLSTVYPYIFLGYAIAGIFGPLTGGIIFDIYNSFSLAIYFSSFLSILGGLIMFISGDSPVKNLHLSSSLM